MAPTNRSFICLILSFRSGRSDDRRRSRNVVGGDGERRAAAKLAAVAPSVSRRVVSVCLNIDLLLGLEIATPWEAGKAAGCRNSNGLTICILHGNIVAGTVASDRSCGERSKSRRVRARRHSLDWNDLRYFLAVCRAGSLVG